ncbi:MAG TPA: OsmC family protein [Bacteroidales bacterium]|nr:OsmC family protein [Bacteroidales bacterium]HPT04995.1 OsmC family protein [Bacteroidales bacterium]
MEVTFDGGKVITAHINGHIIRTDQPEKIGGTNTAPTPFDLFLAAIGTCAGIYVKSFCDMRKIPTEGIKIVQNADYNQETGLPTNIQIEIQLPESFPEKYINAVVNVAEQCKVKNTIKSQPKITVNASKI